MRWFKSDQLKSDLFILVALSNNPATVIKHPRLIFVQKKKLKRERWWYPIISNGGRLLMMTIDGKLK